MKAKLGHCLTCKKCVEEGCYECHGLTETILINGDE